MGIEDRKMAFELSLKIGLFALCIGLVGCERQISFANDVQPIFLEHCAQCHDQTGEGVVASGFSVHNYDGVMSGTKFGQVVVPGSSISSALYLVIAGKTAPEIQMPPHHERSLAVGSGAALSEEQVEIIQMWIDQGAIDN
jgi:hypothetical protein